MELVNGLVKKFSLYFSWCFYNFSIGYFYFTNFTNTIKELMNLNRAYMPG